MYIPNTTASNTRHIRSCKTGVACLKCVRAIKGINLALDIFVSDSTYTNINFTCGVFAFAAAFTDVFAAAFAAVFAAVFAAASAAAAFASACAAVFAAFFVSAFAVAFAAVFDVAFASAFADAAVAADVLCFFLLLILE